MQDVYIHPTAVVDEGARLGKGSKIWHFVHIRSSAKIGENVIIGKGCYIDVEVSIGNNSKIQNLVSVYNGVRIGNNVFVGPHVTFTNDLYPRATGSWEITQTIVEDGVSIGANATIVCGHTLGKNCMIAAGSVVTKDVQPHALIAGNPGKLLGWVCKCGKKIAGRELNKGKHEIICEYCNESNVITVL